MIGSPCSSRPISLPFHHSCITCLFPNFATSTL
jgi:hypothetical protein